jgi:glycosyltransferase involved in cell wall biosynthesis
MRESPTGAATATLAGPPQGARPLPRLAFVGPLQGAVHPGVVVTQGVRLSRAFREAGYPVTAVSTSLNRYARLLDIAATLARRAGRLDIVVVHVYGGPSFVVEDVASAIARARGARIVMLLHGGALPEFLARFPRWGRRVLGRADAIVAPSPFLARTAAAAGFAPRVIPNVIDVSRYPYRERAVLRPRLFWMRTYDPDYNPLMAVEVLKRVREIHPGAMLMMRGQEKGMERDVGALAARYGLASALDLGGFVDPAGKIAAGEWADIFINTSHVDNMPVALVEAAALGMPVVSTAVGGVPDLVTDGVSALLVPDGDADAMAKGVLRLLADPDLAGRLSRAGRDLAMRSAWPAVRAQWEDLFGRLLARGPGPA